MKTLRDMVSDYVLKNGVQRGKGALALNSGLSVHLIEKVARGHLPKADSAYKLATACGCNHDEAAQIAASVEDAKKAG